MSVLFFILVNNFKIYYMTKTYNESIFQGKFAFKMNGSRIAGVLIALFLVQFGFSQVNLTYEFSQSSAPYVPMVGGSQIIAPNTDDGESGALNIGFDFLFDNVIFTQFVANSNGSIRLGAIGSAIDVISSNTFSTGGIAFFARDGRAVGGVYSQLSGVAPNRVLTIQYTTYRVNWDPNSAGNNMNAQIRLYETTNAIEIHYGSSASLTSFTGQVGIRGASTADATNYLNRTTTTNWSASTAGTANTNTMKFSPSVLPAQGLIFRYQLASPPADPPACVAVFSPSDAATNAAKNPTLSWSAATGLPTSYDVYFGTSMTPPLVTNVSAATFSYLPGLLDANTTYYWKIVPKNDNGDAVDCPVFSFTTGNSFDYCPTTYSNGCFSDFIGNVVVGAYSNPTGCNAGSGTFYNNTGIEFGQSTTATVAVTFGSDGTQWSAVWIDFNQDGVYSESEGVLATTNPGGFGTTVYNIAIPADALLGVTRMRIRGGNDSALTVAQACGVSSSNFGESEDYEVTITEAPTFPPTCVASAMPADMEMDVVRNAILSWSGATGFPTSYDVYFGTSANPGLITNVLSTSSSFTLGTLEPNTTYYWKVVPKNDNGEAEGCAVQSFTTGTSFNYCASNSTNDGDTKIGSFTFAGSVRAEADGCVSYTDRTSETPFTVQKGIDTSVSIALGSCSGFFYDSYVKVYIDANQNGSFEDEEIFYQGSVDNVFPGNVISGNINVPLSALNGLTRLRVVLNEGDEFDAEACGTYSYGETQDYIVSIIEPLPAVQLRPQYCNSTLPSLYANIYAEFVSAATTYKFKVVNGLDMQEVERPDSRFSMAFATGIVTGTTYQVSVATEVNGVWSEYGAACDVTTPVEYPTIELRPEFCNAVLTSVNQNVYANVIVGASAYKFKVENSGNVQEIERPDSRFSMAFTNDLSPNTIYDISVAYFLNGAWQAYGNVCSITTPILLPTSQLRPQFCNGSVAALNSNFYAVFRGGAQSYKFKTVINGEDVEVIRPDSRCFMSAFAGAMNNQTYEIQVAVLFNNVWSEFGPSCSLTVGNIITREISDEAINDFTIKAYPNPFMSEFTLQLSLNEIKSTVAVYDMTGKQIQQINTQDNEVVLDGASWAPGVYVIQILQGEEMKNIRVVKQ